MPFLAERLQPARTANVAPADRELSPDQLRTTRAVEALERIASPDAIRLLEKLAGGAPGAVGTNDAKAALNRSSAREP